MGKVLSVFGFAGLGLVMAGCSPQQLAQLGATNPPQHPAVVTADLSGNGTVSPGETVMSAYARTYATNPNVNVTSLQANGLQGFAASTSQSVAATTNATGTFKVATITMAPNGASLTVAVDGNTFTLPSTGRKQVAPLFEGAPNTTFYGFGATTGDGSQGIVINQTHSSLALFIKNLKRATQNSPSSHEGYVLVATGAETPVGQLPAQLATYKGEWGLALANNAAGAGGKFNATANFATKQLTYDVFTGSTPAGSGSATISGNQFAGTFQNQLYQQGGAGQASAPVGACAANCTWTGSGEVIGAFYGPNAEEVTGVISGGAVSGEGGQSAMAGYFIGSKN